MGVDLDEAERIHGAATPGPWEECGHERGGCKCGMVWSLPPDPILLVRPCRDDDVPTPDDTHARANAKAIAHAHNIMPALLAELRALREKEARFDHCAKEYGGWLAELEGPTPRELIRERDRLLDLVLTIHPLVATVEGKHLHDIVEGFLCEHYRERIRR